MAQNENTSAGGPIKSVGPADAALGNGAFGDDASEKSTGAKRSPALSDGESDQTWAEQAKTTAADAYQTAADKASNLVDTKKSEFTEGLTGAVETVRRIGGAITEGEQQNPVTKYAAEYTQKAADKLESAARYFEVTDLKGAARDLESYARRNPAVFLAGAFAVGLLAARLIKSGPVDDAGTAMELPSDADGGRSGKRAKAAASV